jgi:hypothetical protein
MAQLRELVHTNDNNINEATAYLKRVEAIVDGLETNDKCKRM